MSSFQSFLHVSGKKYEILYSDLDIHQKIDSLGRPASPTFGGMFNVAINMPDSGDATLFEWMFDPAKILNCKVVLKRIDSHAVLKTIKFYNAYCTGMDLSFDGTANASSFRLRLCISPEQFDINGLFHDNRWPDESPIQQIADEDGPSEPSLLSDIAHGVLDVAGLVPVVGELADGANALFYLAEGNKTDAALSAAAMIPLAGWAATGAKVVRKGVKIATEARALKKVASKVNRAATIALGEKASKIIPSPSELAKNWQGKGDYLGVDKFRDIVVKKGKVIYAGEPYPSGFFFTKKALAKAKNSTESLWDGLQVKAHEEFGYRTKVGVYEATEDIAGAFGTAKANVKHGKGGLQQVYIPDMSKMKRIDEIILK